MDWQEFWLPVPGFPKYEVNNYGEIRNIKRGNKLRPALNSDGYPIVSLQHIYRNKKVTKAVHVLSFTAFAGPRPTGAEINHIDLNKANPAIMNLEYMTRSQNSQHAYRNLASHQFAAYNNGKKRSINKLDAQHNVIEVFDSLHSAAADVEALPANILRCCQGRLNYTVKGFGWEYTESPKQRAHNPITVTENIKIQVVIVKEYSF